MYYLDVTYANTEKEEMLIRCETYVCLPLILGQVCDRDSKTLLRSGNVQKTESSFVKRLPLKSFNTVFMDYAAFKNNVIVNHKQIGFNKSDYFFFISMPVKFNLLVEEM